ncbi:MAG: hypothetical protein IJW33_05715, partial [Lentisphaeria bacterium]|nr:hypothetical protein [Lentisphaeria bacterium]
MTTERRDFKPLRRGGKRAAPGKLRLRLRWAQGMVSVYLLWLASVVLAAAANVPLRCNCLLRCRRQGVKKYPNGVTPL